MDVSPEPPELAELVDRRTALRARMVELRASDPEDHDGFLRTVDQLLAVSNEIIDRLNGSAGSGGVEGGAQERATGGAEDDAR